LDTVAVYRALRQPRHETLRIRGLDLHVTHWGPQAEALEPPLILLHGWMDAGGTFQFLVDAFAQDRPLVAVDWRGFGSSEWPQDGYWFPDYLGDLDALLDQLSPDIPAPLLGHSMGGNIATLYAGLRPERVRCVVNLEGLGLARTSPAESPKGVRKWLDQLKMPLLEKTYNSFEQLTAVINFRYPRFTAARSAYVASVWGALDPDGRVRLVADPRHHWVNPVHYNREDSEATWSEIRAPMLILLGAESEYLRRLGADGTMQALRDAFATAEIGSIPGAGHMLHIERPEATAPLVEAFLEAHR
jgi:pimeloyl-ACP methyl ester carboxylesterase